MQQHPAPESVPAAERRQANRARHWHARQQREAARGPRGIAASWWDRARAIAAEQERADGNQEAWNELARFLENYCQRYGQ
jgi:hypothetical protein